jgi:plastocyanin
MSTHRHLRRALAISLAAALAACALAPAEPVTVVAENIDFTPKVIQLPPGQGIHLTFENRDDGAPHGLSLQTRTSGVEPDELWTSAIQAGPSRTEYDVPALSIGPYLLICPVHPNMQVEVNVG